MLKTFRSKVSFFSCAAVLLTTSPRSVLAADPLQAASTPAPAPAPSATDAAEAKRHFGVGLKLFKEQVFEAALLEFKQAYKLGRRPSALRNIAQCHRELKQFVEAYEEFERLLIDHSADLKDREKKDIRRAMEDLAMVTATLTVKVNEAGADVAIDGKSVGTTPLVKPVRVLVGTRKVQVTKAGFDPAEKEIALVGQQEGQVEITLQAEVVTGHLVVRERSNNADVHVFIDDKDMGAAPWEGDLAPGVHTVEVKGPKFAAPKQTVEVSKKGKSELVLDAVVTAAHMKVRALPSTATISLDGTSVGTGAWDGDVAEGKHRLDVSARGFAPYAREVVAVAGQTLVQDVSLVAEPTAATAPHAVPTEDYSGIYSSFGLFAAFEPSSPPSLHVPCPAGSTCSSAAPPGGGAQLRIGYNFEFIGVEVLGAFQGRYRSESVDYNGTGLLGPGDTLTTTSSVNRTEDFYMVHIAGFVGLGPRITSKGSTIRFTLGITPGLAVHTFQMGRSVSASNITVPSYTDDANYKSFGLMVDGGILLGSTPGTKFMLGALLWADFPSPDVKMTGGAPLDVAGGLLRVERPNYTVASGTQIFVGPVLGLHFGH